MGKDRTLSQIYIVAYRKKTSQAGQHVYLFPAWRSALQRVVWRQRGKGRLLVLGKTLNGTPPALSGLQLVMLIIIKQITNKSAI